MLIRIRQSWDIPEHATTPEGIYLSRRNVLRGAAGIGAIGALTTLGACSSSQEPETASAELPALDSPRNEDYTVDRPVTPEATNVTYNNFYEFGSHKQISDAAATQLKPRPWQVVIDGLVETPLTMDVDDLIGRMDLEERIYRHRCVEAWSMTVPWIGFPLRKLVDLARPLASAKYLRMETFGDPAMASGIRNQSWNPWPYIEGLTMQEAAHDLSFLVVGAYGKVVPNSMGAPIRLHVPWKYGFKSIKSIVKFSFVDTRPVSFWETISDGREYGFWANVNPDVSHPRWSQTTEKVLGTNEQIPTQLFNGYAEAVGSLYAGLEGEMLYR